MLSLTPVGAVLGPEASCSGHCPPNGFEDAVLAEYTLDPAVPSLTEVTDRIYQGSVGDSSDTFLTVEHDGTNMLYMGGFTRSASFGCNALTGVKDSMLVTLTY